MLKWELCWVKFLICKLLQDLFLVLVWVKWRGFGCCFVCDGNLWFVVQFDDLVVCLIFIIYGLNEKFFDGVVGWDQKILFC